MSDASMTADERPPLFFAGSDDEDENEDVPMELEVDAAPSSSPASSRASSRLFLDDTDDEKANVQEETTGGTQKRPISIDDDSDTEIRSVPPRTTVKAENTSPSASKAGPSHKISTKISAPPAKKRRISSPTPPDSPPIFIGETVFAHAWSNVSGKGYIKIGDEVKIMREPQEPNKSGSSKAEMKKKTGDGKKQMSLTAMLKQPSKTPKNNKTDTIVRLYNARGFGPLF
jgi:DNA repair protein RAD5